MRKISKLSLVAAVAVAGFSTANAQPLEEAIKNVETSGSVVYRYDNFNNDIDGQSGGITSGKNNYKIGLNLSSKVNEYVKFNSRFVVGGADSGFAGLDAKNDSDRNVDVTLSNANFAFTGIKNTTISAGKQGLATPWTVATDINGNEQTGTGVLSLTTVGPVTVALGGFNETNVDKTSDINGTLGVKGSNLISTGWWNNAARTQQGVLGLSGTENIYVAALLGDLDFVNLEAWYLNMEDTFKTYTLAATSKIDLSENAKIGLEARYVNLKLDNDIVGAPMEYDATGVVTDRWTSDDRKNDMFRLAVDGKFNIVNAKVSYTQTGKDGGLTALDQDAKNTTLGWAITSNGIPDAKYWQAALGADILDNLNFTVNYGNLESKEDAANLELEEVYGQLTYKMSKNLTTYVRYGNFEAKEKDTADKFIDQNRGRIQVAYSF
ncbi:major outer membrane protein [Aliarcobacter butzleri]|uniref:major outer membrane protein n=1 Tax=Aliarcobacter butzleri TaxID=28197 RepID=UPI0021B4034B|nr:major outer membrane protein [Aliarcobacter butzleri]MCT7549752.1 major outer membrane protein [Aliarcobacter butzleri]MCT7558853.1 major outer membrane protein [Aliarcobacter butzleri]